MLHFYRALIVGVGVARKLFTSQNIGKVSEAWPFSK